MEYAIFAGRQTRVACNVFTTIIKSVKAFTLIIYKNSMIIIRKLSFTYSARIFFIALQARIMAFSAFPQIDLEITSFTRTCPILIRSIISKTNILLITIKTIVRVAIANLTAGMAFNAFCFIHLIKVSIFAWTAIILYFKRPE